MTSAPEAHIRTIEGQPIHSQSFHHALLNGLTDGVYFVDHNRRILFWNRAAEIMTGFPVEQVIGTCCADNILRHVDEHGLCLCEEGCPLAVTLQDGNSREAHVFLHHSEGHRVPVHVRVAPIFDTYGAIIGAVETFSDDTARLSAEQRLRDLEQAALLDELTGLANRRYFNRSLEACLADYRRNNRSFGLVLIDVDHFKLFNDKYGHAVGDETLCVVARTLIQNSRPHDTPVRWGGEEFAILSQSVDPPALYAVAERARLLIAQSTIPVKGTSVGVTVSVGATMVRDGDDQHVGTRGWTRICGEGL
ncbi:MAG: sensor domain-containing diguanylate cyclase, partial [bacterium]